MAVFGSDATIETTVVRGTQESESNDGIFADGICVVARKEVQTSVAITDTQVTSNGRIGLLVVDGTGELSNIQASSNRFGLVLQGSQQPAFGEGNVFDGNTEQDRIVGGDLAVPNKASPLP